MNNELVANKNITLGTEFSRYIIEHPEFGERIPKNALLVFLPAYDPGLCKANLELAKKQREKDQPVVHVHIEKIIPQKSRLINPRIELETA